MFDAEAGGVQGQFGVEERRDSMGTQAAFDAQSVSLVLGALENLEQDEIADRCSFQFGGRPRSMAAQVGDPDQGVDENHGRLGFALSEDRPLFALAMDRHSGYQERARRGRSRELLDFLSMAANAVVAPVHPKAMSVILSPSS